MSGIRAWSVVSAVLAMLVVMTTLLLAASDLGSARPQVLDDHNGTCPRYYWEASAGDSKVDRNRNGIICVYEPPGLGL